MAVGSTAEAVLSTVHEADAPCSNKGSSASPREVLAQLQRIEIAVGLAPGCGQVLMAPASRTRRDAAVARTTTNTTT